jgi:hypothetical protein
MRILKRCAIAFVILFVLTGVVGYFIFPYVLKAVIVSKGSEYLNRKLSVEKIDINPYTMTVRITGFSLTEPSGKETFVSFKELFVNINGSFSLAKRALILEAVSLDGFYAGITRHPDGTYNFTDLIKEKKEPDPNEEPLHFSVSNITITHGSLDFRDEPVKAEHTARDILIAVPFVSNIEHDVESYVKPAFSATVNGHKFAVEGKTKPFDDSKSTSLDISLLDLDIPSYMKYVPMKLNGELASARLDTRIKLDFVMGKDKAPTLKLSGDAKLRDTVLKDSRKNTVFSLPALSVALAESEPLKSDIHLSRISIEKPALVLDRNKKGDLNLLGIFPKGGGKKEPEKKKEATSPAKEKNPLKLKIDECVMSDADIAFTDAVPAEKAKIRIAPLTLSVKDFSNQKDEKAEVSLSLNLNKKGSLKINGPVCITPLTTDLSLDLKDIAIRAFQPYFTDKIKIDVTKGTLGTKGRFKLSMDNKNKPKVTYDGEISVSRLATIDKARANDFIKWRQLYFDKLRTGYNPFFLDIKGISLTDYYAKLVVNPDGSMNVSDIFGDPKGGKKKPAPKPQKKVAKSSGEDALKDIRIGRVSFQGGTVFFADNKIKPNYSVTMLNLTGSVTGLSSKEISRARVDLRGNLGYGSPVLIAGKINPLSGDLFLDLGVKFKDIELSPTSPYTSTFLGYPVSKGKLDLNVSYLIDKKKLKAENKISFNQLTFGDKVESEKAIKAPVKLAVALLTDRYGQINLDVPLSGSLDDPKFKIWPVVWQVLKNLIVKAVTAPFSLLASLGADEESSFLEFDYGSAVVPEASLKKIDTLTHALYERPNLNMDIEPYVDLENDKEGLKRAELMNRVKAQKLKASLAKGGPAMSLAQVTVGDEEYPVLLVQAYHAETFPKPRTADGRLKALPKDEMEKLMMASIDVGESELRQLASRRAEAVKELFLKTGKVDGGRIFVVEPKTLSPEKNEKMKDSRVIFLLK